MPDEWGVISNGRERATFPAPGGTTHVWAEETPIVPYMTTVAIDKWTFDKQKRKDGTPIISAFAPGTPDSTKQAEAKLPEILDFLESKFGKYPIDAAGGIFLNEQIGFSLETMKPADLLRGLVEARSRRSSTRTPTSGTATRWPSTTGVTSA